MEYISILDCFKVNSECEEKQKKRVTWKKTVTIIIADDYDRSVDWVLIRKNIDMYNRITQYLSGKDIQDSLANISHKVSYIDNKGSDRDYNMNYNMGHSTIYNKDSTGDS